MAKETVLKNKKIARLRRMVPVIAAHKAAHDDNFPSWNVIAASDAMQKLFAKQFLGVAEEERGAKLRAVWYAVLRDYGREVIDGKKIVDVETGAKEQIANEKFIGGTDEGKRFIESATTLYDNIQEASGTGRRGRGADVVPTAEELGAVDDEFSALLS